MNASCRPAERRAEDAIPRRGVLLLIVLSMLTLFLMLGATFLVVAIRARETARAYARLTFGSDEARIPHARLLDTVALGVIRGGVTPTASGAGAPGVSFESLLADKYGSATLSGTATAIALTPPVISCSLTMDAPVQPSQLNGRILTFVSAGRRPSSHRIIRARATGSLNNANTNAFDVALDLPFRGGPISQPAVGTRVVVNDREFTGVPAASASAPSSNEAWDGFDFHNIFLAQVGPGTTPAGSTVSRLSFIGAPPSGFGPTYEYGTADQVPEAADNDGDGVPDGVFLDFGLPPVMDAIGTTLELRASVLVVDLDGRFNVNAHGSLAPVLYTGTHPGWTTNTAIVTTGSLAAVPMGSGYGPADIPANLGTGNSPKTPGTITSGTPRMFDTVSLVTTGTESPRLGLLAGLRNYDSGTGVPRMRGVRPAGSRYTAGEATPYLRPTEGRYGEQSPTAWLGSSDNLSDASLAYARPGAPNLADAAGLMVARQSFPTVSATITNGVPALWWNASSTFNSAVAGTTYPLPRGIYNAPPDLHGRMKTLTLSATTSGSGALAPQLVYAQPEWSTSTDPREIRDNPYELQLDTRRGFGGLMKDPATAGMSLGTLADNPFTPAELEAVLRPYDIDTNRCPPRLAALLGSAGEDSRLKVTTDSWDSTAITGGDPADGAAARIFAWLSSGTAAPLYGTDPVSGIIGGEVARGEKFNLRRPLSPFTSANAGYAASNLYYRQRQAFFKDFYTLLVALDSGTAAAPSAARAAELAQWAANVVEYSDADSRMTPFEYDKNPQNGWTVDGDATTNASGEGGTAERGVVWGAERPEILIREAFAWRIGPGATEGGLGVTLHRPWNAIAVTSGSTTQIAGEPCDHTFDTLCSGTNVTVVTGTTGIPGNRVDLGKKAGPHVVTSGTAPLTNSLYDDTTQSVYPIWRLRLVAGSSTSYVRFDTDTPGMNEFGVQTLTKGDDKPKLGVDSTISFVSNTAVPFKDTLGATVTGSVTLSGSACPLAMSARFPDGNATGTIYLERLSDPSVAPTPAEWTADPLANPDTGTARVRYVVVDSAEVTITNTQTPNATLSSVRRNVSGAAGPWRNAFTGGFTLTAGGTAACPTTPAAAEVSATKWFVWPNRPLISPTELALVPRFGCVPSPAAGLPANYPHPELLDRYQSTFAEGTLASVSLPVGTGGLTSPALFDAVRVPTWFAGIHGTTSTDTSAQTGIFNAITPVNQFSSFREPGRVNLNTVTSDDVWNSVVGGPLPTVATTRSAAAFSSNAGRSLRDMLRLSGTGSGLIVSDTAATSAQLNWPVNPSHRYYTATRLANTVTPRSNVFAMWVTLRAMVPNDPDSVRYFRSFYIIDRSIPVAFENGMDHNVRECIRLRRIIE